MLIAAVITILLIASVAFHFLNPWQQTTLASNWGSIDNTLTITFLVCGIFFIAVMLFITYCLIRYRHRNNHRAHFEPENKKLESWLAVITSVGICAMLAPGLVVYGNFIKPPDNAIDVEVLGQQWMWTFRFSGQDNLFGKTAIKHISPRNPFGIDPSDPNGQDDLIVQSNELHLPVDQPINFLLRSIDVLHNFYIPQLRAKMDLVPGIISSFWATPTLTGKYEILCAELCGVGHSNMRGHLFVDTEEQFNTWLSMKPTFAELLAGKSGHGLIEQGRELAHNRGCFACHSIDGSKSLGPGWQGLYGVTETLSDGATVQVDEEYIRESIVSPSAKIVQNYPAVMVSYDFSDEQLSALTAYIKSLGEAQNTPSSKEPPRSDNGGPLP